MVELSARHYLAEVLPTLLDPGLFASAGRVVVQFLVVDREDCNYCYRLSAEGIEVSPGVSDEVDLTVAFYEEDLVSFSQGKLDIPRAVREGRLKVYGDDRLLALLASALRS